MEEQLRKLRARPGRFKNAYEAGYNCGLHGADTWNCSFTWFRTPADTKEWERGKKLGAAEAKRKECP